MRPAGLTAVCIISLILGLFGSLAVLLGCVGLIAQPAIMKMSQDFQKSVVTSQSPQVQQQLQQQEAMMNQMAAVQKKWMVPSAAAMLIAVVAVVGLIVGSIKGLYLKPQAHKWMIAGMTAGIVHALVASYIGYATQRDTQGIVMQQMNQTMQAAPGGMPPGAAAMTNSAMQASMAISFAFIFGWAFVKCAYYATAIWYLLTPRIRRLFEGDGSDRAIIDALSEQPT